MNVTRKYFEAEPRIGGGRWIAYLKAHILNSFNV